MEGLEGIYYFGVVNIKDRRKKNNQIILNLKKTEWKKIEDKDNTFKKSEGDEKKRR